MIMVSWNCSGLGSASKLNVVKELISIEKPPILLIQETKMNVEEATKLG
jgi:exonuclease III